MTAADLTNRQRHQLVHAFRLVKKWLLPYHPMRRFICLTLPALVGESLIQPSTAACASAIVEWRLGEHASLEHWLTAQGVQIAEMERRCPSLARDLMYRHRQQWLDRLIEEFRVRDAA